MRTADQHKYLFVFILTTLFYILTKALIFKGFNGADDLHYAMLASKMLKGGFDPFQPGDIFSGRVLLIASQAVIYKLIGINSFSTQLGSLLVVIASCYLTVCWLLPVKNGLTTFFATSLFYFNPVITNLSFQIRGDFYVMLSGVLICLLLRSWVQHKKTVQRNLKTGCITALIIAISLLYKETMLVFLPVIFAIAILYDRANATLLIFSAAISFILIIFLYALVYKHFTGDAFFKFTQIKNSNYPNHCSYDLLPLKELVERLTYGEWQEYIIRGFYPVILGGIISVYEICTKGRLVVEQNFFTVLFFILLLTSLYFPFSLHGYQPLCSDARQFIFLLPLSVLVTTDFIFRNYNTRFAKNLLILGSSAVLMVCIFSTGNKWSWMMYLLILLSFLTTLLVKNFTRKIFFYVFPCILWISILEHVFFQRSNWFYDMIKLNKQITSTYYYFPDHDNMMHWQLLHHFDTQNFAFYNLQKNPFKIYKIYYQYLKPGTFNSGWLILNKAYNVRSQAFLEKMDSLKNSTFFAKQVTVGDMDAFLIDSPSKLGYIKSLIQNDN